MNATIEITAAVHTAVRVKAEEIRVGDSVFDIWGRTYGVTEAKALKTVFKIVREDGHWDHLPYGSLITIQREVAA